MTLSSGQQKELREDVERAISDPDVYLDPNRLSHAFDALEAQVEALREALVAHRLAAAILVGTVTSTQPELLAWAEEQAPKKQPHSTAKATKQIVADVRRYDEGTAGTLADDIRKALALAASNESLESA